MDLRIHFVKANGRSSPKVFKLGRASLDAGDAEIFRKTVSLAVHTTRKPYPGEHQVDAQINGQVMPLGIFHVIAE